MIHDFMERLCARGYIHEFRLREDIDHNGLSMYCRLYNGDRLEYRLTQHEIANGGVEAIRFWLDTIERDVRMRHHSEAVREARNAFDQTQREVYDSLILQQLYGQTTTQTNATAATQAQAGLTLEMLQQAAVSWHSVFDVSAPDPKAAERSKELFILACGKEAFDTLDAGKPLAITGSKGTKYTLHKRSTYCVERVSNNVRLCAVVPSVPLFDHLLGIKLMIEHDEPKFLETANAAHAGPYHTQAALAQAGLGFLGSLG